MLGSIRLPALVPLSAGALSAMALAHSAQSAWVDWVEETSTRIVGEPAVTTADPEEKDLFAADLDNDGDTDVIVARKVPFSVPGGRTDVLLMNENGVLVDRTAALIPAFLIADDSRDVIAFDSNGDGWLDIVTANTFTQQPRLFVSRGADASGTFLGWIEDPSWFSPAFVPGPMFCAVAAGDVTGDGMPDLFFSDYQNFLEDRLLVNDGTGKFVDESLLRLTPAMMTSAFGTGCVIEDFNGDGWNDIVKISTLSSPQFLRMLINDGTGFFQACQDLPYMAVYMLDAADFNNDGRMDLYVEQDAQDYLLINDSTNPEGTINVTTVFISGSGKTAGFGGNVHCTDLNRDGFVDAGVADVDVDIPGCNRRFAALRNKQGILGTDGMADPNDPTDLSWNTQGNHDFAWIDLDGDGFTDMLQGTCNGLRVFMMRPFASTLPYGNACPGTGGAPAIGATGVPRLGNPAFEITLSAAIPGVVPFAWFSLARASIPLLGCELVLASPLIGPLAAPATDGVGGTRLAAPIPNNPALEGVKVFAQWVIPDPSGALVTPFGNWAASAGMEIHLSANALP